MESEAMTLADTRAYRQLHADLRSQRQAVLRTVPFETAH